MAAAEISCNWARLRGPSYQAGTLSGNPLAVAAGIETLKRLREPGTWEALEQQAGILVEGLHETARKARARIVLNWIGTMFTTFFAEHPVTNWETA